MFNYRSSERKKADRRREFSPIYLFSLTLGKSIPIQRPFSLLQSAKTRPNAPHVSPAEFESLDAQHHSKWSASRANHDAKSASLSNTAFTA